MQSSKDSELELGHEIQGLKRHYINLDIEKSQLKAKYSNIDNTICFYKRNMVVVCNNQVLIAKVNSWQDLMDDITEQGQDWLTILKVAL